jgi:hypothetical protein
MFATLLNKSIKINSMKKLALLAVVVAFGATACKKTYKCTCTSTVGGVSTSASATSPSKMKKADAEKWCDSNSSSTAGVSVTCKSEKA